MKQKYFTIYSKALANRLCRRGYHLVESRVNNQKPWLYVYVFEKTEGLLEEIEKYREEKRK